MKLLIESLGWGEIGERICAGQGLIQQHAQAINIGLGRGRLVSNLFGREVGRRADNRAGLGLADRIDHTQVFSDEVK